MHPTCRINGKIRLVLDGVEVQATSWRVPSIQMADGTCMPDREEDFSLMVSNAAPELEGRNVEVIVGKKKAHAIVLSDHAIQFDGAGPRLCDLRWVD